jgi:diguanylate cyclase (GGDEF)-like protein
MPSTRRFRLLRHFSIQSALVTAFAAVVMIFIYERHERGSVIEAAERQNVQLAHAFANALSTDQSLNAWAPRNPDEVDRIDRRVAQLTRNSSVLKIKIFQPSGLTVYSSDPAQIGTSASANAGFRQAVDSRIAASKTSFRGSFSAYSGVYANVHLAETYVPIVSASGDLVSVLELYTDITASVAEIDGEARVAALYTALAFFLHFLASLFIVGRADRILRQQQAAIDASHADAQVARARLSVALKNMAHGLTMFDASGRLVVVSARFFEHYGLKETDVALGTSEAEVARLIEARGFSRNADAPDAIEFRNGSTIVSVVRDVLPEGGFVCTHEDVTARRRAEDAVSELARTDHLTQLANRHQLERVAQRVLDTEACATGALLLIDLDGFKPVNDTHGHLTGDRLLQAVARRLRDCQAGQGLVARIGGDEFAVLQLDGDASSALALAEEIVSAVRVPFGIDGRTVRISASVGVAMLGDANGSLDTVLQQADAALYDAKRSGKGQARVYDASAQHTAEVLGIVQRDLLDALRLNQIELHYQPVFDAQTMTIRSAEALARWRHPQLGLITPADFIPAAERCGLIHQLGSYIIERACQDAAEWPAPIKVAINLSPMQFERPETLLATLEGALSKTGLDPERIIVEVTEGLLLKDDNSLDLLRPLQDDGLTIALDDFGKGYANLDYLQRFRFDKLKIDGCFIADLETSAQSKVLVRSIIDLARNLGIATVAEGVNTEGLVRTLRDLGCTALQGFAVSKPMSQERLLEVLAERCREHQVA